MKRAIKLVSNNVANHEIKDRLKDKKRNKGILAKTRVNKLKSQYSE